LELAKWDNSFAKLQIIYPRRWDYASRKLNHFVEVLRDSSEISTVRERNARPFRWWRNSSSRIDWNDHLKNLFKEREPNPPAVLIQF